jgi:hypothetical protein
VGQSIPERETDRPASQREAFLGYSAPGESARIANCPGAVRPLPDDGESPGERGCDPSNLARSISNANKPNLVDAASCRGIAFLGTPADVRALINETTAFHRPSVSKRQGDDKRTKNLRGLCGLLYKLTSGFPDRAAFLLLDFERVSRFMILNLKA